MSGGQFRARFEEMGLETVRPMVLQWSGDLQREAREWVSEQDLQKDRAMAVQRQEDIDIARASKRATVVAAYAAVISVPLSILAVVISLLAWLHPTH